MVAFRSWFAGLFRWCAETIDPVHPRDPALAKMFGLGASTTSGMQVDESKVLGYPAVIRGVSIVSNAIAKVRPRIYQRIGDADKRRATTHPSYSIVSGRPCPEISGFHFRQTLQHYAMLWGNGCAYIYRDGSGRIVPELGMVPLPPDSTRLVRIKAGEITTRDVEDASDGELFYVTRIGGQMRKLLPENVFHVHGLGYSGLWGYSVVDLLKETFGLGLAAREFGARFFGQGSAPSGYVTYPQGLDEEAEERWRNEIKSAAQGLGKAHRVILLEHGSTFIPATIPPDSAQFLETRQFEIREIANAIGVQPHKLGDPSRKSYASLEQSNQEHLDDDLDPWLVSWEETYANACLTEREKSEDSHFVEFDRRQFLRTNLAARTAHYQVGMQWGWYSVNDVRRKESEAPIGPEGDQRFRPLNMVPLDAPVVMPDAGAPGQPVEQQEPDEDDEDQDRDQDQEDTEETRDQDQPDSRADARRDAVRLSWLGLCQSILARQGRRIVKQAIKSAGAPGEFGRWLQGVEPDSDTPEDCREAARAMYAELIGRLSLAVQQAKTGEELRAVVVTVADQVDELAEQFAKLAAEKITKGTL